MPRNHFPNDAPIATIGRLAASPATGKVTEAEVTAAYEAAKAACEKCTKNFCGDCDCNGFTCKEGVRAAIASLGLEVG